MNCSNSSAVLTRSVAESETLAALCVCVPSQLDTMASETRRSVEIERRTVTREYSPPRTSDHAWIAPPRRRANGVFSST